MKCNDSSNCSKSHSISSHSGKDKFVNAAITIQKHFRGYLTRKYIEEFRYQIYCVVRIQKAWRTYCFRKKMTKKTFAKKNLMIDNSEDTIKDFNSEQK